MLRIALFLLLFLSGLSNADAETYTWTDNKGVVNFTDDPGLIPARYRAKVRKSGDITIRNPKVQEELKEQEIRAVHERSLRPVIAPTPDYEPLPQTSPAVESPGTATDELPPGRTKSQRIRDNIERRTLEEKTGQPVDQK